MINPRSSISAGKKDAFKSGIAPGNKTTHQFPLGFLCKKVVNAIPKIRIGYAVAIPGVYHQEGRVAGLLYDSCITGEEIHREKRLRSSAGSFTTQGIFYIRSCYFFFRSFFSICFRIIPRTRLRKFLRESSFRTGRSRIPNFTNSRASSPS